MSEPHKRRWYQFSLKTLLLVMLVFSVTVGWIGSRMHGARENRARVAAVNEAVAAIEEAGGKVTSSHEDRRSQTWLERQFDDPGSADDPVGILIVTVVEFSRSTVTDDDLEHVKGVTALNELWIGGDWIVERDGVIAYFGTHDRSTITDAGMSHLKGLTNLRTLDISHANVSDIGLERLKELTNLRDLRLKLTQVTDAGLKHLKGLTNLEELDLSGTKVTDTGLGHLKGLTNLEYLNLWGTKVTDEGALNLQQVLLNCKIDRRADADNAPIF